MLKKANYYSIFSQIPRLKTLMEAVGHVYQHQHKTINKNAQQQLLKRTPSLSCVLFILFVLILYYFGFSLFYRGRVQNSIKNTLNLIHSSIVLVRANSAYFCQKQSKKYIEKIHQIATSTTGLLGPKLALVLLMTKFTNPRCYCCCCCCCCVLLLLLLRVAVVI